VVYQDAEHGQLCQACLAQARLIIDFTNLLDHLSYHRRERNLPDKVELNGWNAILSLCPDCAAEPEYAVELGVLVRPTSPLLPRYVLNVPGVDFVHRVQVRCSFSLLDCMQNGSK